MPPRKRKAPTKAATPVNKKVRVGDASIIAEPEETVSARPKRKSVGTPQYKLTRTNRRTQRQADDGVKAEETIVADPLPQKRRGRPPKAVATTTPPPDAKTKSSAPARTATRGRPAKNPNLAKTSQAKPGKDVAADAPATKKRGRPRKSDAATTTEQASSKTITTSKRKSVSKTTKAVPKVSAEPAAKGIRSPRKRGRPRKMVSTRFAASLMDPFSEDVTDADLVVDEDADEEDDEHQYWLMKAEPNDRYENGVNVKFSIDDLAAAQAPEPWDGVRNFAARNNMRAMRKGDLAFFYHSNCSVPGIVGVIRIVQEHSTDKSAFDPNHPYYDPKSSPSNPKWDVVHVELVKKFDTQITLKMMQEDKNNGGELQDMQLLRLSRLSVSAVTAKEWRYILGMANEDVRLGESEEIVVQKDGYEADTDGEVDAGPKEELNGDIAAITASVEYENAMDGRLEADGDVEMGTVGSTPGLNVA